MIPEVGQDYDINVTDARPDNGRTFRRFRQAEAASWGKIDPDKIGRRPWRRILMLQLHSDYDSFMRYSLPKTKKNWKDYTTGVDELRKKAW